MEGVKKKVDGFLIVVEKVDDLVIVRGIYCCAICLDGGEKVVDFVILGGES